jgi:crotonobetainyl-CoA:carnitine CoA-transferase CaiB-like acyl-CoA transferase
MIADVFARMTATAIVGRLEAADIAFARRNSVAEFVGHPQLAARDCWTEVASPVGSLRALRPPVRMSGVDPVMAAVPALGEHSEAILGELGFDAATIAGWRKEQMI